MKFFSSFYADERLIPDANPIPIQRAYDFKQVIGQGSFGIVRMCKDRLSHAIRACKTVRKQAPEGYSVEDQQAWKETIRREVINLQQVQSHDGHENLVKLVDVYEDATHVHLVMEQSDGGELYDLVLQWKEQKEKESQSQQTTIIEVAQEEKEEDKPGGEVQIEDESTHHTPMVAAPHEAEAASIIYQILDGISYMHDVHGIVHRDLKASNFLFRQPKSETVDNQWKVQIIDFGLSKYLHPQDIAPPQSLVKTNSSSQTKRRWRSSPKGIGRDTSNLSESEISTQPPVVDTIKRNGSESSSSSTSDRSVSSSPQISTSDHCLAISESNMVDKVLEARSWYGRTTSEVGTPYYVAPEVLLDDDYDCLCDIWSIGVIAYLLLSRGSLPYQGEDERATIQLLLRQDLTISFPDKDWKNVSQGAQAFCAHLLARDPKQRPTAREAMSHPWLTQFCGNPPPLPPRQIRENLSLISSNNMDEEDSLVSSRRTNSSAISSSRRSTTWGSLFSKMVSSSSRNE